MGVSAQSLGSTVLHWCPSVTPHQRLNSLPVSSQCLPLPPRFSTPSRLFSSPLPSHTLPHRRCLKRWKSWSEPSESLIWFTANIERCLSTPVTATLRISSEKTKPGFSRRVFHAFHCGYLPAVVEGCSWRQPCVDAFEECKAPVNDYLHSFCSKKWVEDKDLVSHPVGVTGSDRFFLTKADKLLHQLSRIHGAKGETWVCGLPGPERSGDRVRHRSHGDASEFRNNSCEAARLLCQRVASQAGKIGACKLSVVELWKQP